MDPFLGEIRLMPYYFIADGWEQCAGQLLSVQQYTGLFSLLGTQYGGNGQTTFALPDLRGRAAIGMGQGPGLSNYPQGTVTGTESVTLLSAQIPMHLHGGGTPSVPVSAGSPTTASPTSGFFAKASPEAFGSGTTSGPMAANMLNGLTSPTGGNQAHENRMPFLALTYCIAVEGIFPQRQ